MIPVVNMPPGMSATIAEEALHRTLAELCRGGSWEGVVRGLAWRVVSTGAREPRSIESLTEAAEAIFVSLIDEALYAVEHVVDQTWHEFLELRPDDQKGALAAACLDALEESIHLIAAAGDHVVEALLAGASQAA